MIDQETQRTISLLKRYVGNSAGLYLVNEMKSIGLKGNIGTLSKKDRVKLAEAILSDIFSNLVSVQKMGLIKSHLYRIFGLNKQIRNFDSVLRVNWSR